MTPEVPFTTQEMQFPWRKALCGSLAMHWFIFRTINFPFLSVLSHFSYYTELNVGTLRKPINSNFLPVLGLYCSAIVLLFSSPLPRDQNHLVLSLSLIIQVSLKIVCSGSYCCFVLYEVMQPFRIQMRWQMTQYPASSRSLAELRVAKTVKRWTTSKKN